MCNVYTCALTNNGIDKKLRGHFRPSRLAINPKIGMLSTKVRLFRAGIHDASSFVIGPVSSVVAFDRSIGSAADAQPVIMPMNLYAKYYRDLPMHTLHFKIQIPTILNAN